MADTLRILRGTGARPRITFYSGGVASDLDSGVPTVTITRPDATTIASGTVSHVGAVGTGTYEFTLAPLAECTLLTITWSGPIGGVTESLTTFVEVVGAHLFTLAEAKAFRVAGAAPLASTADADLMETRDSITDEFEAICGWSFVPRYRRDTFYGSYGQLILERLKVQRIISVTVDGTAYSPTYLADLTAPTPTGVLARRTYGWFTSLSTSLTVIEYVHGFDRVPGPIKQAALKRAAMLLNPSSLGSTASSYSTPGGDTYTFDPAGRRIGLGDIQHTGVPAIDSVLNRAEYQAGSLAVA